MLWVRLGLTLFPTRWSVQQSEKPFSPAGHSKQLWWPTHPKCCQHWPEERCKGSRECDGRRKPRGMSDPEWPWPHQTVHSRVYLSRPAAPHWEEHQTAQWPGTTHTLNILRQVLIVINLQCDRIFKGDVLILLYGYFWGYSSLSHRLSPLLDSPITVEYSLTFALR